MYYFIGIKGTGMSALACLLKDLGYSVMGSDKERHFFTEEGLNLREIKVLPYSSSNITSNMIIIRGNVIGDDHPEIIRAKELDLQIYTYQEMVSKLTSKFMTITVAGCHGKTTTSSMLAHVIEGSSYLIGDGSGYGNKESKYFILEACEYKRHFLAYHPYYAIITNIELDHVDYYKNIDDVIDAYTSYANNAEKMVIACGDDSYTHSLEVSKPIFYYGLDDDNDIIAKNVVYNSSGTSFDVFAEDNYYGHFELPIYGKHMLLDALATISVCFYERMEAKNVSKLLKTFKGAKRRFSENFVLDNVVIDDYAHHPTEIKSTLKAVSQKYPDKKVVAIWQPHTFSRTEAFFDDYVEIFNNLSDVYIADIYNARGEEGYHVTTEDLISSIKGAHHLNLSNPSELTKYKNAVLVFMSPNDLTDFEKAYIECYKNQEENAK